MSKISREEFAKKYVDKFDDDTGIEFLEDVTDSFIEDEVVKKTDYDEIVSKYEDIKEKYKSRFTDAENSKKDEIKKPEELEEKQYIDIKSIFER